MVRSAHLRACGATSGPPPPPPFAPQLAHAAAPATRVATAHTQPSKHMRAAFAHAQSHTCSRTRFLPASQPLPGTPRCRRSTTARCGWLAATSIMTATMSGALSLPFVDLSLLSGALSLPFVDLSLPFGALSLPFVDLSLPSTVVHCLS